MTTGEKVGVGVVVFGAGVVIAAVIIIHLARIRLLKKSLLVIRALLGLSGSLPGLLLTRREIVSDR
jgi:hypothetical protein